MNWALENCVNTETDHKYQVVAYPAARNQTGVRTSSSNESGAIKVGTGESAEDCLANGSVLEWTSEYDHNPFIFQNCAIWNRRA